MIVNEEYKFNKEWLDLLLEHKNNENLTFNLSDNDTRILLTYIEVLQQENARLKESVDGLCQENTQLKDNWNELKESVKRRIKSYEDREKLGKGYELTEVMQITLACDKRFLETMQEIESRK